MTFLLAFSSLLSRLLGVYRNHALAQLFGASALSDAYFAAFQVPDTLYRLLVFGAISASFVPLYLTLHRKNPQEAEKFVASVMNGFLLFITLIAGLVFLFAPLFVQILYPAFSPELQETTTQLLRIMLLSPLFFTFSSIFSGVQNAFRTFWGFALAPIVYNAGIIFGILVLAPKMGIMGVAYGVVLGAFAHAAVQWWPARRLGFRWHFLLEWTDAFRKLLFTAIPRVLSMASFQVNFFIEGVIATLLFAGNLTVLRYAQDMQSFPIGIVGVSVAISSFSVLSHLVIDQDVKKLAHYLHEKLNQLLFLMIPAAFGLYVLRYPLVRLILKGGVFGAEAVDLTASTLAYLCIGLVAAAVAPLVTRVFFAFHDTIRPFIVMVLTVVLNTFLAYTLSQYLGVGGIGLASSLTSTAALIALFFLLKDRYLRGESFFPLKNMLIFVVSGGTMTFLLNGILQYFTLSESSLLLLAQILLLTALGIIIYLVTSFLFLRKKLIPLLISLGK